ncbi:tristetraproline, putative [Entamoeba invadens IP1]|uniref:Tristetraproline, putative n=1 Tax=Entamoeba invadens IP1 TaxID=370355 RepID=A0A0A1UGA0_ENTIV|nr:tristetraproline, putative [Entamoeba invadens IP1]ELP94655.1 tristetraproline, putative [Entamoeba invadens IP1]|eukprot:XP_004261426.1 tristetraproline, putative [Entamoeba invadens IP1]
MRKTERKHTSSLSRTIPTKETESVPSGSFTASGFVFSTLAEPYRPSRSGNASPIMGSRPTRKDQLSHSAVVSSAPSTPSLSHSPRRSTLSTITSCPDGPSSNTNINTSLYKTELCRSYVETGTCRYGAKCQFAHGEKELRPVQRHPRYKTEICQTFQQTGSCKYGSRCRFIHVLPDETNSEQAESPSSNFSELSPEDDSERLPIFENLSHV